LSGAAYVGWGVRQLLRIDGCEVEPIPYDIKDYDLIIVGTPVWMFTLTPPMRAFLKTHDFSGKDVVVSCCNDGDKGYTLGDLAESMPGSRCIGKIDFQSVLKSDPDSAAERAQQWVKDLLASR
jgi:flavodoxin